MSGLFSDIGSILFGAQRSIGGIIPDITVRELGTDELEITSHPVETNAAITDHAFVRPTSLRLEYGFTSATLSNYGLQNLAAGQAPTVAIGNQRIRQVYEDLLALQSSRQPFEVVTGKRLYRGMLLESLSIETTAETENALMVSAVCRQIITVSTRSTTLPPQERQAMPASTAGVTDRGTVQAAPVTNNAKLAALFGGL